MVCLVVFGCGRSLLWGLTDVLILFSFILFEIVNCFYQSANFCYECGILINQVKFKEIALCFYNLSSIEISSVYGTFSKTKCLLVILVHNLQA